MLKKKIVSKKKELRESHFDLIKTCDTQTKSYYINTFSYALLGLFLKYTVPQ